VTRRSAGRAAQNDETSPRVVIAAQVSTNAAPSMSVVRCPQRLARTSTSWLPAIVDSAMPAVTKPATQTRNDRERQHAGLHLRQRDIEERRRREDAHREEERRASSERAATTPVGTSNTARPAENAALATKTSKKWRPASSRNSVLTPQIAAADSV
jgi:hypothetical protein